MKRRLFLKHAAIATAIAATTLAAPAGQFVAAQTMQPMNIAETAMADPQFSTLVKAVIAAELPDALKDPNASLTVFAPTDAAFAKLDPAMLADLLKPANKDKLRQILLYHVVPTKITSKDVRGMGGKGTPKTLHGSMVNVTTIGRDIYVNEAKVIKADIPSSNGVIHAIDTVLIPPDMNMSNIAAVAMMNPMFNTLSALVTQAGLGDALKDPKATLTVFAPTDEAFAKLPKEVTAALLKDKKKLQAVLLYHVLGARVTSKDVMGMGGKGTPKTLNGAMVNVTTIGDAIYVNEAKVIKADVPTTNGVIHVIDRVLLPPDMMAMSTIAAAAMMEPMFNTLSAAVTVAGLGDTLKDPKSALTVLAPTDEAFAKLPAGTVEALLKDPEALKKVLLYHVIPGKLTSRQLKGELKTVNGAKVNLTTIGGSVYANEAKVIKPDVRTGNGFIHVIDTVLLPPDMNMSNIAAVAMMNPQFNTLSRLVTLAGLGDALKDPKATLTVFAPTDAAFAKVPKATLDALAKDPEKLKKVLLYHVLGTKVTSADVAGMGGMGQPKTLEGSMLDVTTKDGTIFVNNAKVIKADVPTVNGVIHAIDAVLLPPDMR
ncbi:MAG: fasciclin domain-containing protein [Anaerolineae bacterium]|nr:fasciclin domain-containing protein [Anaerolineae bacterium]